MFCKIIIVYLPKMNETVDIFKLISKKQCVNDEPFVKLYTELKYFK